MGDTGKEVDGWNYTDLVAIKDGEVMATSRMVAKRFGKQHPDVLRAIRNLGCSETFTKSNFAFREEIQQHSTGASKSLVCEMTRDGFSFLVMGFTGKQAAIWKERFIAAFNEMEKHVRGQAAHRADDFDLNDPKLLQTLLLTHTQKAIELQTQVDALSPKAEALRVLAEADGSLCVTDAAKALQMRPKDLFAWLRAHGWIYKRAGTSHDIGYQSKVQSGYLEHKVTTVSRPDGTEKITEQVRVTPKGMTRLAEAAAL